MGKIELTDEFRDFIINTRKSIGLENYQIATLIGRSRSWYYRVEMGKIK